MMKLLKIIASVSLLAAASTATAGTETVVEETVFQSLNVIDMAQTLYISQHPQRFYENESAWIIGSHPSQRSVVEYMAVEAIFHAAVTVTLAEANAPKWLQRTWQFVTIADKANCIGNNIAIGIKVSF